MTSVLDLINLKGFIDENRSGKKGKMKEKMAYVVKIRHQKVIPNSPFRCVWTILNSMHGQTIVLCYIC